jgi:hypothetical protein
MTTMMTTTKTNYYDFNYDYYEYYDYYYDCYDYYYDYDHY